MNDLFSYFGKTIAECSDKELLTWYIAFCNGADPDSKEDQKWYEMFKKEVPNRSKSFQEDVAYIDSVL